MDRGAFGCQHACALAKQIASALGAAHRLGVVHRDRKPGNIMVVVDDDGVEQITVAERWGFGPDREVSDYSASSQR